MFEKGSMLVRLERRNDSLSLHGYSENGLSEPDSANRLGAAKSEQALQRAAIAKLPDSLRLALLDMKNQIEVLEDQQVPVARKKLTKLQDELKEVSQYLLTRS